MSWTSWSLCILAFWLMTMSEIILPDPWQSVCWCILLIRFIPAWLVSGRSVCCVIDKDGADHSANVCAAFWGRGGGVQRSADTRVITCPGDEWGVRCTMSSLRSFRLCSPACLQQIDLRVSSLSLHLFPQDGRRPPPIAEGRRDSHALHPSWLGAGCTQWQVLQSHPWCVSL